MERATRDLTTGLVCLVTSLVLFALTLDLPGPSLLVPIGPGFYPRIILGITALLSAVLIVQALLARKMKIGARSRIQAVAEAPQRPNYALVVGSFAVFGGYVALLPPLGFRIATFVFVLALQWLLEPPRTLKARVGALVIAVATAFITFHVFQDYLSVLLPRGRWTDF